jgi:hypothetical protein
MLLGKAHELQSWLISFWYDSTERWKVAANEGRMIYQRGPPVVRGVPGDFVGRLLNYINYVVPLLIQLIRTSGVFLQLHT